MNEFIHGASKTVTNVPRSQTNKNVLNSRWNCTKSMSGCHRVLGRLFQTRGPATLKLLSPNRVLDLGTMQTLTLAEQRWQHPGSLALSWHSSARYSLGLAPQWLEYHDGQLVLSRRCIDSQWSCFRTGEMWSRRRAPVKRRAAAFWTRCRWCRET